MKQRKSFKMILFVFLLACTYIFGYVLLNQLGDTAKKELADESVVTTEMVTSNIHNTMRVGDTMAMALSSFSRTVTSLESLDQSTLELNTILDQFVKSIGDSVCYLMNKDGIVVASSNRNAPDSFLGKNYAFRQYFTKAMQGEHGAVFALGITSGLPGYYSSFPVKNDTGDILGVAVVKMNMDTLEAYFHLHSDVVMVSPEGVVFLTGDPLFIGKTISPITESVKQSILLSRQFGTAEFDPLFPEPLKDDSFLVYENKTFLINTRQITSDGWKIYVMRDASRFVHYRLFGLLLILLFYVLIVTFLVIIKLTKRSVIFSYLAAVVYSSQDAIIGKDLSGKILSWNKGAENIYGYTKKEMVGKMIDDLLPKDQVEKNRLIIEAIHQGKVVENFEMKQLRKNGEAIDVSVTISPMRDMTESIVGVSMIAHDISRMKRLEKIKSEFVSIASHQLRTPLTGIKWFSELLLNGRVGALNKAQTEYLQQISDSNQRMINLVNDLLEVSHIDDQGKYKMDFVKVDFADVLKEIVVQQKMIAKSKNVSIVLSPECVKKNILTIDQVKMSQTLQNLLSNAIKFAKPKTKIIIDCSKQKGQLVCSITDQGLGIPLSQQGRIFEKFFRADNAVDTGNGTGLGLYIAKAIVEAHKGKIWFESEEGKGTTFTFSLPLK